MLHERTDRIMNLRHIICLLTLLPFISFGQEEIVHKIDSLKYVDDMPYICRGNVESKNELSMGCGDKRFWSTVKQKEKAIPFLLEKLNDTTMTEANVPNFGYNYSVADIAYVALEEIIHGIPTFELLGVKFDQEGCGYCSYWQHLDKNYKNKANFKIAVQNWYNSNKDKLVWVENNDFTSCDCSGTHPNNGHYELKK